MKLSGQKSKFNDPLYAFFKYQLQPKCNDNGFQTLHCFRDLDLKEDELDDKSNEIGRLRDSIKDFEKR